MERDATPVTDGLRMSLGLQMNPRPSDTEAATRLVREHGVDSVLAIVKWCTTPPPAPATGSIPDRMGSGGPR